MARRSFFVGEFARRTSAMVGFSALAPVLGFLLSVFTAVPAFAQDKIVLQLKWDHQAQFAGYYAALWQGFYADAGLDVEIRSAFQPGGRVLPATEVLEGRADFGIGAADLLLTISAPLIIASSVLQHSGFGIVTLEQSGISSPADLVGLRVATRESSVTRAELDAVLAAEGVDISLVKWVQRGRRGGATSLGRQDRRLYGVLASIALEAVGIRIFAEVPPTSHVRRRFLWGRNFYNFPLG